MKECSPSTARQKIRIPRNFALEQGVWLRAAAGGLQLHERLGTSPVVCATQPHRVVVAQCDCPFGGVDDPVWTLTVKQVIGIRVDTRDIRTRATRHANSSYFYNGRCRRRATRSGSSSGATIALGNKTLRRCAPTPSRSTQSLRAPTQGPRRHRIRHRNAPAWPDNHHSGREHGCVKRRFPWCANTLRRP